MLISQDRLRRVSVRILTAAESSAAEAEIVTDHLVEANLKGHDSHGVGMIPAYIRNYRAGRLHPNRHIEILREDGAFAVIDGQMGYGQVIASEATGWAIGTAKRGGIAIMALRHVQHVGRVGAYGEQACAAGLISLSFVNTVSGPPRVAPWRGSDGRISTNPICIAIPGADPERPLVLDFATSKIALGKVRVAHNEGYHLAENILIDAEGQPTTHPAVIFNEPKGAVLPFGDHKGSGLALICELLAGALTGGATVWDEAARNRGIVNGMLSFVLDPARLAALPAFQREIDAMIDHLKASPPADPEAPVLVAGEPERLARVKRLARGIEVDPTTWREIGEAAEAVGIAAAEIDRLAGLA